MYNVQFGDLQFAVVDNALGFTYAALNTAWFYQTDIYAETEYALQAGHKLLLQSQHLVDFVGIVFGTNFNLQLHGIGIVLAVYQQEVVRLELRHFEDNGLYLRGEHVDTTDNQHVITTSQDAVHTNQCTSAGALIVVQGGEVLGTVAQQRHPLFGKVSEHQFAGLTRSNRLEGLRVYNLGK